MATPAAPQNLQVQTGNQNNALSWAPTAGAFGYHVYRSVVPPISTAADVTNFLYIAGSTLPSYLDTNVSIGVAYWYTVAATNSLGSAGPQGPVVGPIVPAPTGEMSLSSLRLAAQQKADRPAASQFVTTTEWNTFINLAMNELYDLLITTYEDYFMAPRIQFIAPGNQSIFSLPNGSNSFLQAPNAGPSFIPAPFYKLLGVDLGLQTANNAFVTVNKYMLKDRNTFVFPNTASTIYGVFNLQYRVLGSNIEFIPQPSGGQLLQILYVPRLPLLLLDTDLTTIGFSGWLEYVIVRAAKYALDKEESDTTRLDQDLMFIQKRIEETAPNRDAGAPERITNSRGGGWGSGGMDSGPGGSIAGW